MQERLIVGLDVPTVKEAEQAVRELDGVVSFYKIGYQLAFAGGLDFARELASGGTKIFLDMKLLDIDHTVAKGVENIVRMGMTMLTIHAYPKAMRAAVEAARGSELCLLAVSVLTSMDEQDVIDAGYEYDPHTLVLRRSEQALHAGMGGIVCSAEEAEAVRRIVGPDLAVVTPGIRPTGSDHGDQKRVVTPGASDPQRLQPSCRRPADRRRKRQARGGGSHPRRDALGLRFSRTISEKKKCPRDTGSPASMCATPKATRTMSPPRSWPSTASARNSWRAAASMNRPKVPAARATSSSSFESLAAAHDCYHSPEYQRAVAIRQKVADGEIVLVEGI